MFRRCSEIYFGRTTTEVGINRIQSTFEATYSTSERISWPATSIVHSKSHAVPSYNLEQFRGSTTYSQRDLGLRLGLTYFFLEMKWVPIVLRCTPYETVQMKTPGRKIYLWFPFPEALVAKVDLQVLSPSLPWHVRSDLVATCIKTNVEMPF